MASNEIEKLCGELANDLARIEVEFGFILPTKFDDAMLGKLERIETLAGQQKHAVQKIVDAGHNLDCIFCGLKDKFANEARNGE